MVKINHSAGSSPYPSPVILPEVEKMIASQGFYLCSDPNFPGLTIPIVSKGGNLYAMRLDDQLAPDRFLAGIKIAGPFHAPS